MGIDDAPFERGQLEPVLVVGAMFSGARLDGVVSTHVTRDGADATRKIARMIVDSQFHGCLQAILVQGIAVAGFNVIDLAELHERCGVPVLTIVRRLPDLHAMRQALFSRVRGSRRKWSLIRRAGALEPAPPVFMQRVGLTREEAERLLARHTVHGALPEPLRAAHLIAGGVTRGRSRGRA